jgi:PD-(D/E)XK endonuclease
MSTNRKRKLASPAPRKNTKVTGERSEAAFLHKAATLEFGIAKPWGDSRRYDFILDNGDRLHRIQVKCTEAIRARAYETRATYSQGSGRAVYTKKDIDFIAAHVVPLDIWYIIPVEICTPAPMLRFYPHRQAKKIRLESYREAWHLLKAPEQERAETIELNASAEEENYTVRDYVGTAALGCPPSAARQGLGGASASARELRARENLCHSERSGMLRESGSSPESRNLLFPAPTKPVRLAKTLAPWPIPPLKILATRKGKHILPKPPES